MQISRRPKSSLLVNLKDALLSSAEPTDTLGAQMSRSLRLTVLNHIIRPARRVENSDVVSFTERQLDLTLARLVREAWAPWA